MNRRPPRSRTRDSSSTIFSTASGFNCAVMRWTSSRYCLIKFISAQSTQMRYAFTESSASWSLKFQLPHFFLGKNRFSLRVAPMAFANKLPAGYLAIPIHETGEAPLRLSVLVRQTPDPVAGHFVLLRDLHDALVYLGCIIDARGGIREWVELWVQNVDGLESSLPAYRETFSNHSLDGRWTKTAEAFRALSSDT